MMAERKKERKKERKNGIGAMFRQSGEAEETELTFRLIGAVKRIIITNVSPLSRRSWSESVSARMADQCLIPVEVMQIYV
jgi:hypothetical protein